MRLVSTKDHGDGSYLLEFTCMQPRACLDASYVQRASRYGTSQTKLYALTRLWLKMFGFRCPSPRSDVVLTRTCKLSSNDPKMDVFPPVQRRSTCVSFLRPASPLVSRRTSSRDTTAAIAAINWPEVGDHKVDVRLDGESLEAHPCKSRLCRKSCVWPHASFKDLVCIASTAGIRSTFVIGRPIIRKSSRWRRTACAVDSFV